MSYSEDNSLIVSPSNDLSLRLDPESFIQIFKSFSDTLVAFLDGTHPKIGKPGSFMEFVRSLSVFMGKAYGQLKIKEEQTIQLAGRVEDYFNIQRQLAENIGQIDELKSLLNKKENDIMGLKDERRVLSDKIALLNKEKFEIEQTKEELIKNYYELKQMQKQSEVKSKQLEEAIKKNEEEGKMKLQVMIQEMEKESSSVIKSLEDQMEKLGQENKVLQKSCKGMERSEATMKQMIERMNQLEKENSEKEKVIERFKQFEEERKQLREENEELQSDLDECHQLIENQAAHVEDLKGELKRAEERMGELEHEEVGEQTLDDRFIKIEIATQQMNEMNSRVKKLSLLMQKLSEENALLKRQQGQGQGQQNYFQESRPMFVAL